MSFQDFNIVHSDSVCLLVPIIRHNVHCKLNIGNEGEDCGNCDNGDDDD